MIVRRSSKKRLATFFARYPLTSPMMAIVFMFGVVMMAIGMGRDIDLLNHIGTVLLSISLIELLHRVTVEDEANDHITERIKDAVQELLEQQVVKIPVEHGVVANDINLILDNWLPTSVTFEFFGIFLPDAKSVCDKLKKILIATKGNGLQHIRFTLSHPDVVRQLSEIRHPESRYRKDIEFKFLATFLEIKDMLNDLSGANATSDRVEVLVSNSVFPSSVFRCTDVDSTERCSIAYYIQNGRRSYGPKLVYTQLTDRDRERAFGTENGATPQGTQVPSSFILSINDEWTPAIFCEKLREQMNRQVSPLPAKKPMSAHVAGK